MKSEVLEEELKKAERKFDDAFGLGAGSAEVHFSAGIDSIIDKGGITYIHDE